LVDAESGDLPLVSEDATSAELATGVFALAGATRSLTFTDSSAVRRFRRCVASRAGACR